MYAALDLSKYIICKCIKDNHPISNLQLQKILYYIQKEFLKHDSCAFSDEIEAWQFGPVVPVVYYYYCGFGSMTITSSYDDYVIQPGDSIIVNQIVEEKRKLDPWTLVAETHKPEGAWAQIYQNGKGSHKIIPVELIKKAG
ncbi:MAG: DUF4065 domain-containing protein [Lachnospiraceae bacterium]|nr:DUF4065 domain-containing protein [Lachnospiraceae bacterium]